MRGIRTAYGADLSGGHLVVVRCVQARHKPRCETVFEGAVEPGAAPAALAKLDTEWTRPDVILAGSVSAQDSFVRWIHTPLNAPAKAIRVLPSLLDVQIPFPLETCEHAVVSLRRAGNGAVDLLAVAARREDLQRRLAAYADAGLDPEVLDQEGLALWTQSLRELPLERDMARIVAYVGAESSTLVLGQGPDQSFTGAHGVRLGAKQLFDPRNGEDAARQFALRAQQVARAQIPGRLAAGALQWLWAGPGAGDPALLRPLEEAMQTLGPPRFHAHGQPTTFLARSLAFRALGEEPLLCNLRGSRLTHRKTVLRAQADTHRAIAWLGAASIALCLAGAAWHGVLQGRDRAAQSALTRMAQAATGLSNIPRGQELLVTRRALDEQRELFAPFKAAFEPTLAGLLARILEQCSQVGVSLEAVSLRPDGATLQGAAKDWNHCDMLSGLLQEAGFATEVQREDAGADERVHFSIKASRIAEGQGS